MSTRGSILRLTPFMPDPIMDKGSLRQRPREFCVSVSLPIKVNK
jgi:hypothetical protein